MNILFNFIGTKENLVIPKLTSKKFKAFSKRKNFISLRIFSYSFFYDYFSFFYDLDNDFLRNRYVFKDRLKKKFCIDYEKNEKISRIIRPFSTYIFTIRKNKFYLLSGQSKRKQERRSAFWCVSLKKNYEFFFNFYRNFKFIYNPFYLQFCYLYSSSIRFDKPKKISNNFDKNNFFLAKTKKLIEKPKKFNFKFFRNFNKKKNFF